LTPPPWPKWVELQPTVQLVSLVKGDRLVAPGGIRLDGAIAQVAEQAAAGTAVADAVDGERRQQPAVLKRPQSRLHPPPFPGLDRSAPAPPLIAGSVVKQDFGPHSLETRGSCRNMDAMTPPPEEDPDLVARAAAGDRAAVTELLEHYRGRLRRMVALRLDPRLRGRVDASDVIQEGYLDDDEQMTNGAAAAALGLEKSVASRRYNRALARLGEILAALPGVGSEEGP